MTFWLWPLKQRRLPKRGFSIEHNLRFGTVIFALSQNFDLFEGQIFLNKLGIASYKDRLQQPVDSIKSIISDLAKLRDKSKKLSTNQKFIISENHSFLCEKWGVVAYAEGLHLTCNFNLTQKTQI